jgi:bacterial/archaeal transporter family protein
MTAILAKAGLSGMHPDLATFLRTIIIVLVLGAVLAVRGTYGDIGTVSGRSLALLTLSGLATGASWLCYFRALSIGDAARVAPVDKLSVVLVAVIAVLFLGEHLGSKAWAGIALIGAGVVLVALS